MRLTRGRSRRFLRNAERYALSRQIAVAQHVVVNPVHMNGHAWRLIGAFGRWQVQARSPRTQDDWCDHHVQAVETSGGKKTRYRVRATFDQYAAHAAAGE